MNNQSKLIIGVVVLLLFSRRGKASTPGVLDLPNKIPGNLPRGIRNNNPGNIRITQTQWQGKVPNHLNTDGSFEQFQSYKWGVRAMIKLLVNYMKKRNLRTVRQIISTYAPSSENNTEAYIRVVSEDMGVNANWPLSPTYDTMKGLVLSMARIENGVPAVTSDQFDEAWSLL